MTRRLVRIASALTATAIVLYALQWLSGAPVRLGRADVSRLRLSWSARPERIEACRALSATELAEREEHMRQRVECAGGFASYQLRVRSDDTLLYATVARGAGLRHDRPLYLLHEIDVAPGRHRLRISFVRREKTDDDAAAFSDVASSGSDTGLFAGRAAREAVERQRRARAAIPPRLELDTTVEFSRDRVIVVSFDPERRRLKLLGEAR